MLNSGYVMDVEQGYGATTSELTSDAIVMEEMWGVWRMRLLTRRWTRKVILKRISMLMKFWPLSMIWTRLFLAVD